MTLVATDSSTSTLTQNDPRVKDKAHEVRTAHWRASN